LLLLLLLLLPAVMALADLQQYPPAGHWHSWGQCQLRVLRLPAAAAAAGLSLAAGLVPILLLERRACVLLEQVLLRLVLAGCLAAVLSQ
jgi:hypothetical protein